MARLVFIDGRHMGNAVPLHGENTLGCSRDNSIVIQEPSVLPRHAAIRYRDGRYLVSRADPAAPLEVNGKPVSEQALRHGDVVSLGGAALLFSDETPQPPADFLSARAADPSDPRIQYRVPSGPDAASLLRGGPDAEERLALLVRIGDALLSSTRLDDRVQRLLVPLAEVFRPERCLLLLEEQGRLLVRGQLLVKDSRLEGFSQIPAELLRLSLDRREALSIRDEGPRTALCAPLVRNDRVLGLLHLDTTGAPDVYGEDDLRLLNAAASLAAAALDNAMAHERETSFGRALLRLDEASRRVLSALDRDSIAQEAVDQACRVLDCTKASLLLPVAEGGPLTVAASNCIDRKIWASVRVRPGEGFAGRVFREGAPILSVDARGERRYETSSFLVVPVPSRDDGRPVGVLSATDKSAVNPFTPRDGELLALFAARIGIALANAEAFDRAALDPVTRLLARRVFDFRLEEEVRAHRARQAPLALLLCDVDHHKDKADIYGRPAADALLAKVAALLRGHVPAGGFAGRIEDDEFGAVLPGFPADRARSLAQDLRLAVEARPFDAGGETLRATVSIGVASLAPDDGPAELLRKAGSALEAARRAGRNRVESFEERP